MASLNISMPDDLRDFVEKRTKDSSYATPTEYIRSLVREDQKRAEREKLERLLLAGLQSGDPIEVSDLESYISSKKQAFLERAKAKAGEK